MSNLPPKNLKSKAEELNEVLETGHSIDWKILTCKELKKSNPKESLEDNRKVVFGQLLRMILSELPNQDLVQARRVSRSWRNEATWILRNRVDSFGITFTFQPEKNSFILEIRGNGYRSKRESVRENDNGNQNVDGETARKKEDGKTDEKCVTQLTEMLSSCPSRCPSYSYFPATHFKFQNGSLDCPPALNFFSVYGKNIRKLSVDIRKNPLKSDSVLRREIFKLTPLLESLELMNSDEWDKSFLDENVPEVRKPVVRGQNQGQGQGQLFCLKSLKFAKSISSLTGIQLLLKCIQPELPPACKILISQVLMCGSRDPRLDCRPSLDLNPQVFKGHQINLDDLSLSVPQPSNIGSIEKLAECGFSFKKMYLLWSMDLPTWNFPDAPLGLEKTGAALMKILERSKETLEFASISILFFHLLMRQPIFPGFFNRITHLSIDYSTSQDHDQDSEKLTVNLNNAHLPFPYWMPNRNPVLWKNLNEIMPRLKRLGICFMNGDLMPPFGLPFLDANAGENPKVQFLLLMYLHKREMVQQFTTAFPAVEYLGLLDSALIPPLPSMESLEKLIRWVFLFPNEKKNEQDFVGQDTKKSQIENGTKEEFHKKNDQSSIFNPLLNFKSLSRIAVEFRGCTRITGTQQEPQPQPSSSSNTNSNANHPASTLCHLSKFTGKEEKWLLFHDFESWEEISSKVAKLIQKVPSQPDSDPNPDSSEPHFPKLISVRSIVCNQHKNEL